MPTRTRKVAIMGYWDVGKTSLCRMFASGYFLESYTPTIESTFIKEVEVKGHEYTLELVDTAGQDEYITFPSQYSLNIHGYILVYSITSRKSFQVAQAIYDKICNSMGVDVIPVVLVGNKNDLHSEREVTTDQGRLLARKWKAAFIETNSKEKVPVCDIFTRAVLAIERAEGNVSPRRGCCVM